MSESARGSRRGATRRRIVAASGIALAVAAGLLVHTSLPDTAATDIAGDALYAVVAYLLVVVIAPRWSPLRVGAVAAAWCIAVELFQLTGLPGQWGAAVSPVMLVLGTVFDPRDLVVYVATIAVLALLDALLVVLRVRGA